MARRRTRERSAETSFRRVEGRSPARVSAVAELQGVTSGFDWRLDGLVRADRRDVRAVDQDVELATMDLHADEVSRQLDRCRHLEAPSLGFVCCYKVKAQLRLPVMSRSRSNIAATARHPRASTISSAPASPSASPRV